MAWVVTEDGRGRGKGGEAPYVASVREENEPGQAF